MKNLNMPSSNLNAAQYCTYNLGTALNFIWKAQAMDDQQAVGALKDAIGHLEAEIAILQKSYMVSPTLDEIKAEINVKEEKTEVLPFIVENKNTVKKDDATLTSKEAAIFLGITQKAFENRVYHPAERKKYPIPYTKGTNGRNKFYKQDLINYRNWINNSPRRKHL